MSNYEAHILRILLRERIMFEREKTYQDLKNGRFRFDYYLPQLNILLEIDGEQHFHYVSKFFRNRQDFLKACEHDRRKNSYCLANNIKLYRIPYWELKNINNSADIFNPKFLVKNRWHNDNITKE